MQVSYRWLERHVDLSGVDADEVARLLTLHTAEVEGVERVHPHLDAVVVGFVAEREKHPDADKLSVCTVDVGTGENLQIVCGAPNVEAGQKVAVARVGTVLPGELKIKKSKIRGQESRGMICSVRELELGDEHDGIWVLPEEAPVGRPVAEALDMVDWAIEIDNKAITHRPDLWGHRGIARELAAILGRELEPLDLTLPETGGGTPHPVRIESASCDRYIALPITSVRRVPTPAWLRRLLLAVGQRPIELSVDVSNFVMLDLGQPNHLFDLERISEGIVVRDARAGERMTTLDGAEHTLAPEDMLICSGDEPVALAGVMGGEGSKVADTTTSLLLEVAHFHPTVVRRTATRTGLRTDASARFEKSLDPTLPMRAAAHLVRTLESITPGIELPAPATDAGDWRDPSTEVTFRPDRARRLLGVALSDDDMAARLTSLELAVDRGGDAWTVRVPSFRATKDVTIEEDLIEEVGRLVGYTNIAEAQLVGAVRPIARDARRATVRRLQDRLAGGARFHEVLTYSFLPDELAEKVGLAVGDDAPSGEYIEVVNAVSEGWQRVRRSVVPSVLGRLETNVRERDDVRLFEVGKGYVPDPAGDRGQPRQVHELALAWAAPKPGKHARFDGDRLSAVKGVVDDLLRDLGARFAWRADDAERDPWAHPARRVVAVSVPQSKDESERELAFVADVHPRVARALGVGSDLAAASVSIDALVELPDPGSRYQPLPRFPGVKIDVALAVPEAVAARDVAACVERAGKGLVARLELFDLYRGEQLGEGRKSLAYHALLQSDQKTLTDKEGQKFLGRLEREIEKLGGELRRE